jgi:hypothetical protein
MTTRAYRSFLASVSALVALTAGGQESRACCEAESLWSSGIPMPVLINETIDEEICPGTTCTNVSQISWTMRAFFNDLYVNSGSDFRIEYQGTTTADRGDVIPGKVHIFAEPCLGTAHATAAFDASRSFGLIRLCTSHLTSGGGYEIIEWRPGAFDYEGGSKHPLLVALAAELGHIIGMKHAEDCPEERRSFMTSAFHEDQWHIFSCDQDFLQDHFGYRWLAANTFSSVDGLSWTTGVAGPSESRFSMTHFSAANNLRDSVSFITFADQLSRKISVTTLGATSGWSAVAVLDEHTSYPVAVSMNNATNARIHALMDYDDSTGMQIAKGMSTTDGGLNWSSPAAISDSGTLSHTTSNGIASTFDPATFQYVVTWVGGFVGDGLTSRTGEIFYKIGDNPVQRLLAGNQPYHAAETPAVACAPVNAVGAQNCLFAFADGDLWGHPVKWFQASVGSGGVFINVSPVQTHNYACIGPPSVAYYGSSTHPWLIALSQDGAAVFTWRKQGSASFGFVDERHINESPKALPPSLGSGKNGHTNWAALVVGSE